MRPDDEALLSDAFVVPLTAARDSRPSVLCETIGSCGTWLSGTYGG